MFSMKCLIIVLGVFILSSCNKCQECYLVEEIDGNKTEYSIGEFCGDDINSKEAEQLICTQGTCYYDCK